MQPQIFRQCPKGTVRQGRMCMPKTTKGLTDSPTPTTIAPKPNERKPKSTTPKPVATPTNRPRASPSAKAVEAAPTPEEENPLSVKSPERGLPQPQRATPAPSPHLIFLSNFRLQIPSRNSWSIPVGPPRAMSRKERQARGLSTSASCTPVHNSSLQRGCGMGDGLKLGFNIRDPDAKT
jgi:hypothetical protein